ncbi:MAG: hypothetical protein Q9181_007062 [Wetmoreana brouardii]
MQRLSPSVLDAVDKPSTSLPKEDRHPQAEERSEITGQPQQAVHGTTQAPEQLHVSSDSGHEEAVKSNAIVGDGKDSPYLEPNFADSEKQQQKPSHAHLSAQEVLQHKSLQEGDEPAAGVVVQTITAGGPDQLSDKTPSTDANTQPQGRKFKRAFRMAIHMANDEIAQRLTCLDTGADVDVISIDVVESLRLRKERYRGPPLKPLGSSYVPEWQVTFDWHVANFHKTYTSTFAVLDDRHSSDFDVLLGRVSVEGIGFYEVNDKVWFHTTYSEVCVSEADDVPDSFPIELEKSTH